MLRANRLRGARSDDWRPVLTADRRMRGSDILYVQERLFRASVDESLLLAGARGFRPRNAQSSSLLVFLFEPTPTNTLSRVHLDASAQFTYARNRAAETLTKSHSARRSREALMPFVYAPLYLAACSMLPLLLSIAFEASYMPRFARRIGNRSVGAATPEPSSDAAQVAFADRCTNLLA